MVNVPPHQDFKQKVKAKAYKTAERNGIVWVFMGDQKNVSELPMVESTLMPEGNWKSASHYANAIGWSASRASGTPPM